MLFLASIFSFKLFKTNKQVEIHDISNPRIGAYTQYEHANE